VGGGSLIYATYPSFHPTAFFKAPWPPEITADELRPFYELAGQFLDVQFLPANQTNPRVTLMKEAAGKIGAADRFEQLPSP